MKSLTSWINTYKLRKYAARLQDEDIEVRQKAMEKLGSIGTPEAIAHLVGLLREWEWEVRHHAMGVLEEIGVPAIDPLVDVLKHENYSVRSQVVEILENIGDVRIIAPLIDVLGDHDEIIRSKAADVLRRMGQPAVPCLLEALTHKKVSIREKAVQILAQMRASQAVPPLARMLKRDEDANVRMTAATALGVIADVPAITALIRNLAEQEAHVQQHIANVLEDIGKPVVVFLLEMPATGVQPIIPEAIEVLGNIGDPRSVQYLLTLLEENKDASIRLKTAEALLKIGDVRAATMFVMILEHDDHWYLRKLAAEGLGNLRSAEGKKSLMKALEDENPHVRVQAAEALIKIGFPATALLLKELRHTSAYVREEAAEALDRLDWRAESENERISYLAAKRQWKSLTLCGASVIEPLRPLKKDNNREIRESAKECLKQIYHAIDTVVFGHTDAGKCESRRTLSDPDITEATLPITSLRRIEIYTHTYNFHQVERFITYAINSIGQQHLKQYVAVHIYGDPGKLHPNLRNSFENLCNKVEEHSLRKS